MRLWRNALRVAVVPLLLAAACGTNGGTTTEGADAGTDRTARTVKPDTALTTTTGGGAQATTTTGPRREPAGKVVYGWHTALTPAWLDPQESPNFITPYGFMYALHDSMIKHFPGAQLQPSLAIDFDVADDFRSASFTLREGIKFHDGTPITTADVQFTYENYRGTNARIFKDKLDRFEIKDDRNITFHFKEPFVDFLILYGTPASGIGWIVPKAYYEQVGPDGFKANPIGAGPYKLIRNTANTELELEAFVDYWRKSPGVKTIIYKIITDDATRFAALATGEIDFMNVLQGALIEPAKANPNISLIQLSTAPFWLEFPGWERPDSPFNDIRVRQAVSLALNRREISDAETGGFAQIDGGNWISDQYDGALQPADIKPEWYEHDLAKARQLLAEAGYPNGFDVEQLTPLAPYFPLAERVITMLGDVGIRTKLNRMERAAFIDALTKGVDGLPGIVLNISGLNGDAAARFRAFALCKTEARGISSRTCIPELDAKFDRYEASVDPEERTKLMKDMQVMLNEQYVFPYVYNIGLTMAQGPRIANPVEDLWFTIPQYPYIYPFEDIELR
jgi:peptide/nickel transport system substrate-binding protein